MSAPPPHPVELLEWDSRHFGSRIGRLHADPASAAALTAAVAWADGQEIDCLYWLTGSADPATPVLAAATGFRLVDIRLTLEGRLDRRAADPGGRAGADALPAVRPAAAADLPALGRLAAASHHDSRFYSDPRFARERCDALYVAWIERCAADPAGAVLVAGATDDPPAGYITVSLVDDPAAGGDAPRGGQIGLFAVAPAAQGKGLGGRLIAAAGEWLQGRGAGTVRVVTQGRNVRAQRAYQRAGMLTRSLELWYHRWRPAAHTGAAAEKASGSPR